LVLDDGHVLFVGEQSQQALAKAGACFFAG
jgi:hypothetical protein